MSHFLDRLLFFKKKKDTFYGNPMTEQEALNKIPNDWIKDVSKLELEERAKEMWSSVIFGIAEQLGVAPTENLDEMITRLAKAHRVSKKKEIETLKNTCIQNSKIDIFIERYGYLFTKDENGDLSYSLPMLRKITGMALK
jgi:hypothetical protein